MHGLYSSSTSYPSNPHWINRYLEFSFTFCLDASIISAQVLRRASTSTSIKTQHRFKSNKKIHGCQVFVFEKFAVGFWL
ncbi:MAG: hypothetical protein EA409_03330 [Saprospirales bacterium]|nr:MAG: hypothetical protein EA409_03330 [Saprospirales bacterium]